MLATKLLKSPPQRAACADPPARQAMKAMARAYFDIRMNPTGNERGEAARDHAREPDSRQSGKSSPEPIAACLRQINCARPLPQPIEMFMLMSMSRRILAVLALLSLTGTVVSAQTRDVAGSRDYPGIGRFAGSVITGYVMKNFD